MILTQEQINRANTFHDFLRKQSLEYFIETGITTCSPCGATGLKASKIPGGDYTWDTASFCDECNGIGYKGLAGGIQVDLIHFICKKCDGIGCSKCDQMGIVDWVTNIMG